MSLVDISAETEFFTPPQFLHQIEKGRDGVSRSQSANLTADDVERDAMAADLIYDGVLNCFSRKWRLVIAGDYEDYVEDTR